jgi:hypothetical protein
MTEPAAQQTAGTAASAMRTMATSAAADMTAIAARVAAACGACHCQLVVSWDQMAAPKAANTASAQLTVARLARI